jgi:7-cyano-7-deazaguanine synthase in queuosine biosynthesis
MATSNYQKCKILRSGECQVCQRRKESFWLAGVEDPTHWIDPTPTEMMVKAKL